MGRGVREVDVCCALRHPNRKADDRSQVHLFAFKFGTKKKQLKTTKDKGNVLGEMSSTIGVSLVGKRHLNT